MDVTQAASRLSAEDYQRIGDAFFNHTQLDCLELFQAIQAICARAATWETADLLIRQMILQEERWLWARLAIPDVLATTHKFFSCTGTESA